jgi:hypothetical protein
MLIPRKQIKASRLLASRLFKIHRKAGARRQPCDEGVTEFHPTIDGTLLVVRGGDRSLSTIISGQRYASPFACPSSWLVDCEADHDVVDISLEVDRVDFQWQTQAIPQSLRLPQVPVQPLATTPPLSPVDARLIPALAATGAVVDRQSVRFALACVQLDGARGTVTGTDGKRLIRFDGFGFPWGEAAILLPANDVFGSPLLREVKAVCCGLIDNQLVLEASPWTFRLPIETEGRYPDVAAVIGGLSGATNRVYFDQGDLAFIVKHLKQIPGEARDHSPVTLDLNGHVDLTAAGDERSRAMRLRLSRTIQVGKAATISMNRHFLSHAARLGITDLSRFGDHQPVVCHGKQLVYVWQPLVGVKSPPVTPETIQIDTTGNRAAIAS